MSARVMSCLELAPRVEQYSIDEMFLDLTGVERCMDLEDWPAACASTCMTVPV
jgi:DNA polymerase V